MTKFTRWFIFVMIALGAVKKIKEDCNKEDCNKEDREKEDRDKEGRDD